MSRLLDFYRHKSPDSEGRLLRQIWEWDDDRWEQCHDFIQWIFPLDQPSAFNPDAPPVTTSDVAAFHSELGIQIACRFSFERFLAFLGLQITSEGSIERGPDFDRKIALWKYANHNWLRITRVLKSLRLLGFDHEAVALWDFLNVAHNEHGLIAGHSFAYWQAAMDALA